MRVPPKRATKQIAIPGILGGMGPLAHIEFEQRLIQKNLERGVFCDQDHPVWILISACNIPDRTQCLTDIAEDCTPWLIHYGQLLKHAGADFLIVTCNTAHAFYDRVQPQLAIPWIHWMQLTAQFIVETYPHITRIGILGTDGTIQAELYSQPLLKLGLTPVMPEARLQSQIMQSIYHPEWGIKATGVWISEPAMTVLRQALVGLQQQGAELVIAGCSELSVGLARMNQLPLPWIDPLDIAASLTLDLAFGFQSLPVRLAA
jgi:aspartate racemase